MICPDCGSDNTGVIDYVFNPETNEHYRLRKCKECLYRFYSTEFIIEPNAQFMREWKTHNRYVAYNAKKSEQRRLAKEKKNKERKANVKN